jgi:hypothetical protein
VSALRHEDDHLIVGELLIDSLLQAARARYERAHAPGPVVYRRLRAQIAPESVIRDHDGRLVGHDEYARLVTEQVLRSRS